MLNVFVSMQNRLAMFRDERGQTMAEYGVVLAVIAVIVVTALTALRVASPTRSTGSEGYSPRNNDRRNRSTPMSSCGGRADEAPSWVLFLRQQATSVQVGQELIGLD